MESLGGRASKMCIAENKEIYAQGNVDDQGNVDIPGNGKRFSHNRQTLEDGRTPQRNIQYRSPQLVDSPRVKMPRC